MKKNNNYKIKNNRYINNKCIEIIKQILNNNKNNIKIKKYS